MVGCNENERQHEIKAKRGVGMVEHALTIGGHGMVWPLPSFGELSSSTFSSLIGELRAKILSSSMYLLQKILSFADWPTSTTDSNRVCQIRSKLLWLRNTRQIFLNIFLTFEHFVGLMRLLWTGWNSYSFITKLQQKNLCRETALWWAN